MFTLLDPHRGYPLRTRAPDTPPRRPPPFEAPRPGQARHRNGDAAVMQRLRSGHAAATQPPCSGYAAAARAGSASRVARAGGATLPLGSSSLKRDVSRPPTKKPTSINKPFGFFSQAHHFYQQSQEASDANKAVTYPARAGAARGRRGAPCPRPPDVTERRERHEAREAPRTHDAPRACSAPAKAHRTARDEGTPPPLPSGSPERLAPPPHRDRQPGAAIVALATGRRTGALPFSPSRAVNRADFLPYSGDVASHA